MKLEPHKIAGGYRRVGIVVLILGVLFALCPQPGFAQLDEGAITGVVQDTTGAVIPNAEVTLTEVNTNLVLKTKTNKSGIYVFSPVRIGDYEVSAKASGFSVTVQKNLHLEIQARLNVVLTLKPSTVSTTVTVNSAPPLLQTQSGSVGQVLSSRNINHIPLSGRNSMYAAQLAAGVVPSLGSRGSGTGDFSANGQRPEQNNYILDGIDNNTAVPDFLNGSSYVVNPPPDALAELNIQTGNYSAEFGHSAGAVVNESVKSGTNQFHGDLWEYFRNAGLAATDWNAPKKPPFRDNQFGATLGGPILRNKLFFFGFTQANRVEFGQTYTRTVPTAKMRQGDFSELLNPAINGSGVPVTLYEPGSAGTVPLSCNNQPNVMCQSQIDSVAQKLLNMYPKPNANNGNLYDNYVTNVTNTQNSLQWGARVDWNVSSKNQTFIRYIHSNAPSTHPSPLGPVLDGGGYGSDGNIINRADNFAFSETHIFSPSFVNQVRFGYNYGDFAFHQFTYSQTNIAASLGLGGIPSGGVLGGGLPLVSIGGISGFGPPGYYPNRKSENIYEIMDDATKTIGNHSIKFGVLFQSNRFTFLSPPNGRGTYNFGGFFTSTPGKSYTGFGVADFLADYMSSASVPQFHALDYSHWNRAAYIEDDWRTSSKLTLNLGVRYNYFQPVKEVAGQFANFYLTPLGPGSGKATLTYTDAQRNAKLSPQFISELTSDNIPINYTSNPALVKSQVVILAPRFGFAYSPDDKTVFRGGFGMFYGGFEDTGGPETLQNYPFQFTANFPRGSTCVPGNCATDGITLENGFKQVLSAGLLNDFGHLSFNGSQPRVKPTYTESYNLAMQQSLMSNLVATLAYVGNVSRHLVAQINNNSPEALVDPRLNTNAVKPFPTLGNAGTNYYEGISSYNALQAKLQKRYANGLDFLATYTWSHTLNDAPQPLGGSGFGYRNTNLIGIRHDYTNAAGDVSQRLTFNGYYRLPFGKGRRFLHHGEVVNALFGGWADDLEFTAQTGFPFSVGTDLGGAGPNGAGSNAILVADPFAAGGSPQPSNASIACPSQVQTKTHWYNPCAFANPPLAFPEAEVAGSPVSTRQIVGLAALPYLGSPGNQIHGPGFERINTSLFKSIKTFRSEYAEVRVDIFNVLNTPSYASPSFNGIGSAAGKITGPRTFQNFTPDARFFQLSVKYVF